jgi:uncharacterized protein (TIGR02598 family)
MSARFTDRFLTRSQHGLSINPICRARTPRVVSGFRAVRLRIPDGGQPKRQACQPYNNSRRARRPARVPSTESRPTNCSTTSGFSLVEVALAVAVIAIGLIAILGLFPQGLHSARNAADNTLAATIAQDLFSQLRSSAFDNVSICNAPPCPPGVPVQINLSTVTATPIQLYFDHDGFLTNAPSYYRVILAHSLVAPNGVTPLVLSLVQATVVWPDYLSSAPINTNIFMTEIAWYDNP